LLTPKNALFFLNPNIDNIKETALRRTKKYRLSRLTVACKYLIAFIIIPKIKQKTNN